jgi:predicted aspartyl protease
MTDWLKDFLYHFHQFFIYIMPIMFSDVERGGGYRVMVFNTTFNNISVIPWQLCGKMNGTHVIKHQTLLAHSVLFLFYNNNMDLKKIDLTEILEIVLFNMVLNINQRLTWTYIVKI